FLVFSTLICPKPRATLFPYTTLFRSKYGTGKREWEPGHQFPTEQVLFEAESSQKLVADTNFHQIYGDAVYKCQLLIDTHEELTRSEEHTSELQSRFDLVCRLLLEKKK